MEIKSRGGLTQMGVCGGGAAGGGGRGVRFGTWSNEVVKQPYKMAY
jgi:hypothetical protein